MMKWLSYIKVIVPATFKMYCNAAAKNKMTLLCNIDRNFITFSVLLASSPY